MHKVKREILLAGLLIVVLGMVVFFMNYAEEEETQITGNILQGTMEYYGAVLKTNFGEIEIQFFGNLTPVTAANFIKLAEKDFYNGTKFHRVIKGFMIQGGDPLTKDDSMKHLWGTGGPGYQFADEISNENHNLTGTISMANAGPNTNGSQFFINVADNVLLDSKHTVFGKVVRGMDVVIRIENTETEGPDRPLQEVIIEEIILQ